MCGICGYIDFENTSRADIGILRRMAGTLFHRGPDDEGFFVHQNVGFGFRRLSIIDLKTGHQPISNEDETVVIIFNGEIYNFVELRKGLIRSGHIFKTRSDTEVLVHLYEDMGERLVDAINGMFAFAIWDGKNKKIFCARDRCGKKPFYYAYVNDRFIFASEPKAILANPFSDREISLNSLSKYLAYEYVPTPHTIYKDIKRLPPGHKLTLSLATKDMDIQQYWDFRFDKGPLTSPPMDEDYYCKNIRMLLKTAVHRRLVSDVPLGVFLSGGVDSTAVVSLMAEMVAPKQIKTFSIGFEEQSFDESSYARRVADIFGTTHHEKVLTAEDMLNIVDEVVSKSDEPFADASIMPTYLLSKFTREYVTVALGGDGGDELFAGYPTFKAHILANVYNKIPFLIRDKIIPYFINMLPVSDKNFSLDFQAKRFIYAAREKSELRNQMWLGSFNPQEQKNLFTEHALHSLEPKDVYSDIYTFCDNLRGLAEIDKIIYLYTKFYLPDDILTKVDRASMYNSLEVRSPFLDTDLIQFVNKIPWHLKIKGLSGKYIFKKAMEGKIPKFVTERRKKGFGIPVAKWIRGELKNRFLDAFSKKRIRQQGLFEYSYVKRLLDEHLSGKVDHRKKLWTLFMFQMWYGDWYSHKT